MSRSRARLASALAITTLACNSTKSKSTSDPDAFDDGANTGKQLAASPQVKTLGTARAFKFAIELPAGAKVETKDDYTNYELGQNFLTGVSVTVRFEDDVMPEPTSAFGDDAAERVVTHRESLPGGGWIALDARKDHRFFELAVERKVGAAILRCSVMQRVGMSAKDPVIADFDAVIAWGERVCKSVAPG